MLSLSLYTHLFKRNNRFFLFNSSTLFFCEISEDLYSALYNKDFGAINKETILLLRKKNVVIAAEDKYTCYEQSKLIFHQKANDPCSISLVIAPTTHCNFNCPYCFEAKKQPATISNRVIEQIFKLLRANDRLRNINLTWYGGEPLIAIEKMKEIWNLFPSKLPEVKISSHSIVTNGFLINRQIIVFFEKSNLESIQITLDGDEISHNKTRKTIDGQPTFNKILSNIKHLAYQLPKLKISIRINLNKNNQHEYVSVVEKISALGCSNISAYPGFIREDAADKNSLAYATLNNEEITDFMIGLKKAGFTNSVFPTLRQARGCPINSSFSLIIGPRGELYKCWNDVGHKERVVGSICNRQKVDQVRLFRYLNECHPFNMRIAVIVMFFLFVMAVADTTDTAIFMKGGNSIYAPVSKIKTL